MGEKMTDSDFYVLELFTHNKSMQSPLAFRRERPEWDDIDKALTNAFKHGGYVRLDVLKPEDIYIRSINMTSLPGKFRLIILTNDPDPKNELLEWWEPGETSFRGAIRFGDDDWDARTVSGELSVARQFFNHLYNYGKLTDDLLSEMRSQWNPKP